MYIYIDKTNVMTAGSNFEEWRKQSLEDEKALNFLQKQDYS